MNAGWAELGIGEALTRLAVARGGLLDDTTSEVYLDCLGDLDPMAVGLACEDLALEPRREFDPVLPPVGEIRIRAEAIARREQAEAAARKLLPMPRPDESAPRYVCPVCRDEASGWRLFWCPGRGGLRTFDRPERDAELPMSECGRSATHVPHTYADRCACVETNPVIAAHRQRQTESVRRRKDRRSA